ncbi:MAG: GCD complex subunit gcd7 [Geoglossum umbratile]|nr:MAG: GCD complex subunit gcd7 [Geoglossum umbratile]
MAVGNIVRRVLHLIRSEAEDNRDGDPSVSSDAGESRDGRMEAAPSTTRPVLSSSVSTLSPLRHAAVQPDHFSAEDTDDDSFPVPNGSKTLPDLTIQRPPLLTAHSYSTTTPMITSMFNLLSHPGTLSPATPGTASPTVRTSLTATHLANLPGHPHHRDLKPDIIGGIEEIIDELDQVDTQIAAYALEHIHANEIILTHSSSLTVQKFLLRAAAKRHFTVIHAESYPNGHTATHATITGTSSRRHEDESPSETFQKTLTAAGVTVILIPDSAIYALMSRVNKVILGTHAVLANGGLVAAAGSRTIANAAREHSTPVVVVSGVYKLSPVYPFDFEALIEHGDAGKVVGYDDRNLVEKVQVVNPVYDYVPAELVNLYITNIGGHAPSYLYKIVSDHYRVEDIIL